MKKVYVSGAISGVARQEYKKRFDAAARAVEAQGFKAVNPTRFWVCRWRWLYKVLGYDLTLLYDLWRLSKCAHIYKIPGWQQSRGANIESGVAFHFGLWTLPTVVRERVDRKLAKDMDKWRKRQGGEV